MDSFLKVLTTLHAEISEIISTVFMKDRYKYDNKKMQYINSKSWNILMQYDLIMNCWFIYQKNLCFTPNPISSVACLNLSMLHFFIADWNWVKSFSFATLFLHNSQSIIQTFDTKGATEIDFNTFQFG